MILSMTGFSSQTSVLSIRGREKTSVVVEIKSLNSRFFEATCKLPSSLNFLEIPLVNELKQKLLRGRVFVSVRVGGNGDVFEKVTLGEKIVKEYLAAAKKLKKKHKVSGDLEVADLVGLPSVFSFEREPVGKSFETSIMKIIRQAIDKLISTRKVEGRRLSSDLKKRFDLCNKHIDSIKKLFDVFMKKKKEEVKNLLILAKNGDQEAERQVSDCYDLINKIDINEEIVRFKSHLKNAKKLLTIKQQEKGKRFEFNLQELSREINTIAAKCSNFNISSLAVDVKVELEKVREQVQNIV